MPMNSCSGARRRVSSCERHLVQAQHVTSGRRFGSAEPNAEDGQRDAELGEQPGPDGGDEALGARSDIAPRAKRAPEVRAELDGDRGQQRGRQRVGARLATRVAASTEAG